MNDKAISRAISNIHTIIVDFLIFIFLSFFIIFFTLRIGLDIDKLILPNLQFTNVYIKWNEKLSINIDQINVTESSTSSSDKINLAQIKNILHIVNIFKNWVEFVHIKDIQMDSAHASLRYAHDQNNYLIINTPHLSADSSIVLGEEYYSVVINEVRYFDKNVTLTGTIIFDLNNINIHGDVDININNFTHFGLDARADLHEFDLAIENTTAITSLSEIVSLFDLSPLVTPWIDEYTVAKEIKLSSANMHINLDKDVTGMELLKSFFAHVRLKDVEYTFEQGSEPIKGREVEIIFSEGKLYILPVDATFYTYDIKKTWVYLDFTDKRIPLHIYINTDASLDHNLLGVLGRYGLDVPVLQYTGVTHIDQYIKIFLNKIEISALGHYQIIKGDISYSGVDLNISDASITIKNSTVTLEHLLVDYNSWAQVKVDGEINLKEGKGILELNATKILIGSKSEIQAKVDQVPLNIRYFIDKNKGDRVEVSKSSWNYNGNTIHIDAINTPFDLQHLQVAVPTTFISVNKNIDALMTGKVDFNRSFADFNVDLLQFNFEGIQTKQTNTPLELTFNGNVKIVSKELSRWSINGLDFILNPTHVEITPTHLNILESSFNFNDTISSNIKGNYNFLQQSGLFTLSDTHVSHQEYNSLIDYQKETILSLKKLDDELSINIPEFHTRFKTRGDGWSATIKDISTFYKYSNILKDYNLSKGKVRIHTDDGKKPYHVSAHINYPYALIVQNDQTVNDYYIKAQINEESSEIQINHHIDIHLEDDLIIESKNVGFNFDEILRFIAEHNLSKGENSLKTKIYASNSFIYITPERRVIADAIIVKVGSKLTNLEIFHQLGYAHMEYKDQSFYLYGQDFNDVFMNALFSFAQMQYGTFSFAMSGDFNKFNGIARVDDTIIKDYVTLNNLLAFFNTIPSLASFKLPDYNSNGLKTIKAYTGFVYNEGNISLSDIHLDSKELDIKGEGYLDMNTEQLDIDLFLKTDLGSNLSKIPIVGYILLGDDGSISTSVKMSGPYSNPKINNALIKDIISAPFNILKRTITYPFKLFSSDEKESK